MAVLSREPDRLEDGLWLTEEELPDGVANREPDRHAQEQQEAPRQHLFNVGLTGLFVLPQLAWMGFLAHEVLVVLR